MARKRIVVSFAWLAVAVVGGAIFYHLRHQPFYYDAYGYVAAAQGIREQGLLSEWPGSVLRSYGYPVALTAPLMAADALRIAPLAAIFIFQWTLFAGSAWLAATTLFDARRTQLIAFVAVAGNPLLVLYTAQALTEALTLSCILFSVAALGRAVRTSSHPARAAWLAAGAVTASYALAVRPGNLLVPICYLVAAIVALFWRRNQRAWLALSASAVVVLVGVVAPLVPQMMVNWHNYEIVSPLPATDISAGQSVGGIRNIRYATNVSTCGEPVALFVNPLAGPTSMDMPRSEVIKFYALNWPNGPETAAMHIFSGLDPRPYLTYQVSYGVWYERILQGFSLAVLCLAGFGLVRAPWSPRRIRPDLIFLGATTLASVAILAVSQVELRFGVVLVTALSILAAGGAARLRKPTLHIGVAIGVAYAIALLAWFVVSDLILATSAQWQACS